MIKISVGVFWLPPVQSGEGILRAKRGKFQRVTVSGSGSRSSTPELDIQVKRALQKWSCPMDGCMNEASVDRLRLIRLRAGGSVAEVRWHTCFRGGSPLYKHILSQLHIKLLFLLKSHALTCIHLMAYNKFCLPSYTYTAICKISYPLCSIWSFPFKLVSQACGMTLARKSSPPCLTITYRDLDQLDRLCQLLGQPILTFRNHLDSFPAAKAFLVLAYHCFDLIIDKKNLRMPSSLGSVKIEKTSWSNFRFPGTFTTTNVKPFVHLPTLPHESISNSEPGISRVSKNGIWTMMRSTFMR